MSKLIERLIELEADVRYQQAPADDEAEFRYVRGQIPILLSAPHGAVHTRKGKSKEEDEYTAGMVCLVAELTHAHVLYARRKSRTDPNWYADAPYKKRLKQIVEQADIRFVLDIHGAAASRNFGIALGTMGGKSCPDHRDVIVHALEQHGFERGGAGLNRLDVDHTFSGRGRRGQETVTGYVASKLGVPAAQFELNAHLRVVKRRGDATPQGAFRGEPERIEKTVQALVALIQHPLLRKKI